MFVGVLALNALFLVAGVGVLHGAHGWATWRALTREAGLAYIVGLAGVGVLANLALIVGLPLSLPVILLLVLAVAGCGITLGVYRRHPRPSGWGGQLTLPRTAGDLLTALAMGVTLLIATALYAAFRHQPLIAYDAWNFWIPKAKSIYFFGGLDPQLLRQIPAPSYPLFVPALDAMVYRLTSSTDATALAQQYGVLLFGLLAAIASLVAPLARRGLVWLFLAVFVLVPELELRWFQLLGDWTLDAFFVVSALLVLRWLQTRESWLLGVLPITLAATFITKREGQLLVACLAVGGLAATARELRKAWPRLLAALAAAYLVSQLPWRIWWTSHHFPSDLQEGGIGHAGSFHRAVSSVRVTFEILFDYGMWKIAVPLALLACLAALLGRRRRASSLVILYGVTTALLLAGFAWVMWSDPAMPLANNPALNPVPREVAAVVLLSLAVTPVALSLALADVRMPVLSLGPVAAARSAWPRATAWVRGLEGWQVVGGFVVVQWVLVAAAAATIRHAGWIFYQGGDQLWYYTQAWLFAHGHISVAGIGYLWSSLLAPLGLVAGPNLASALPAIVVIDVLVFLPVVMAAVYGIAIRLGGRVFAIWTLALWCILPFVGILYTDAGYHQRYTELLLPQAFGLTAMADFPAMVATVVAAYFCVRVLVDEDATARTAAAAGLAAGAAFAIKPSAGLFLVAPAVAFIAFRRFRSAAVVVVGLLPAALTLAVWKYRGLGTIPVVGAAPAHRVALGSAPIAAAGPLKYFDFNWSQFLHQLDLLREHFWSARLVEWVIVGGAIAIIRISPRIGSLCVVWFGAYAISRGTYQSASIEDGSLLRLMIPAYPVFVLLVASLPFLLPGTPRRLRPERGGPRVSARTSLVLLVAVAAVTAVVPLAAIAASSPDRLPDPHAVYLQTPPVPNGIPLGMRATTAGNVVKLAWSGAGAAGGPLFFHVYRGGTAQAPFACIPVGAIDKCDTTASDIGITMKPSFTDRPPKGTWQYRVGVAANWLNDPHQGDVYFLSAPVTVKVP